MFEKTWFGGAFALSACASDILNGANLSSEDKHFRHKFREIDGGVLFVNASGYEKKFVTMYTQSGQVWMTFSSLTRGGGQMAFTSYLYIPKMLRVVWRGVDAKEVRDERGHTAGMRLGYEGGDVLGDYTVPVANRIPDEVLDYIRTHGGALYLKIHLKDNGVAVGWGVEERLPIPNSKPPRNYIHYTLDGGDYCEDRYEDGKDIPGWEK